MSPGNDKHSVHASGLEDAIKLFHPDTADLALRKFLALSESGCDEALSFVGDLYFHGGQGVAQNVERAKEFYEAAIEANGSVAAYLGLIKMYFNGLGVEQDYCQAYELCGFLVKEIDHPYAHFYLGRMYMNGLCVDVDFSRARNHFETSWSHGYVFALTELGFLDKKSGHLLRSLFYRIKAAAVAYFIAVKNPKDHRVREL